VKRLLLFLALLALGFVALRLAIGDEQALSVDAAGRGPGGREPERSTAAPSAAVPVQQGSVGAGVTLQGSLDLPHRKTVVQPDGSRRAEVVFVVKAADSRPLSSGVQQLDRVELLLFDRGAPAATLHAAQAFVVLQRDAAGNPTFAEGKDIDLRDVVMTSAPGSRLEGLRLELATAKVAVGEAEVKLTTASAA
jgi:hypothetical protein